MTSKEFKVLKAELTRKARLVVIQRKPYTCVVVEVEHNGQRFVDFGFSKCNWPDWFLPRRGKEIALGRAIESVAMQIVGGTWAPALLKEFYLECAIVDTTISAPEDALRGWIHFTQIQQNSTIGS